MTAGVSVLPDLLRGARSSFVARALTLPVGTIASLLGARLVVGGLGPSGYATYALIIGLATLIPMSDLGVGAAVTDAVARRKELGTDHVERVLRTSARALCLVSALLVAASLSLGVAGVWPQLLGLQESPAVNASCAAALTAFALGLPLTIAPRVLLGAERNDLAVWVAALASLSTVLLLGAAVLADAPLWAYTVAPFAAFVASNLVAVELARRITGIRVLRVLLLAFSKKPGQAIRHLAGPMAIISLTLPIAYQSDRLVLSWVTNLGQVASYSLAAQLFAALYSLVAAAGMSLWPVFARTRSSEPVAARDLLRITAAFSFSGLALGLALCLFGPILVRFMGHGEITVRLDVLLSFALLLFIHASYLPTGMILTDGQGLRFQAITSTFMVILNLPLSVLLARAVGASGPVLASCLAILLAMWIPGLARVFRNAT